MTGCCSLSPLVVAGDTVLLSTQNGDRHAPADREALGARISHTRKVRRLTQGELADLSHVSYSTLTKVEQGVLPAQAAPRVVQRPVPSIVEEAEWARRQNDAHRSPSTDASPSPKSRVFRSERPATFADYGALRDYMMQK